MDPAYCSECWCVKPSNHSVRMPSRDRFDSHQVYKEEPESGESEALRGSEGRDFFQREQNVTKNENEKLIFSHI